MAFDHRLFRLQSMRTWISRLNLLEVIGSRGFLGVPSWSKDAPSSPLGHCIHSPAPQNSKSINLLVYKWFTCTFYIFYILLYLFIHLDPWIFAFESTQHASVLETAVQSRQSLEDDWLLDGKHATKAEIFGLLEGRSLLQPLERGDPVHQQVKYLVIVGKMNQRLLLIFEVVNPCKSRLLLFGSLFSTSELVNYLAVTVFFVSVAAFGGKWVGSSIWRSGGGMPLAWRNHHLKTLEIVPCLSLVYFAWQVLVLPRRAHTTLCSRARLAAKSCRHRSFKMFRYVSMQHSIQLIYYLTTPNPFAKPFFPALLLGYGSKPFKIIQNPLCWDALGIVTSNFAILDDIHVQFLLSMRSWTNSVSKILQTSSLLYDGFGALFGLEHLELEATKVSELTMMTDSQRLGLLKDCIST